MSRVEPLCSVSLRSATLRHFSNGVAVCLFYDNLKDGYAHFEGVGDRAVEMRQRIEDVGGCDLNHGATAHTHVHLAVYPQVSVRHKKSFSRVEAVLS